MPPAARTRARPAKSSGGQTGSSSQVKVARARSARAIAVASATVQGQFVSTISRGPAPIASRTARTIGTSISCSFESA